MLAIASKPVRVTTASVTAAAAEAKAGTYVTAAVAPLSSGHQSSIPAGVQLQQPHHPPARAVAVVLLHVLLAVPAVVPAAVPAVLPVAVPPSAVLPLE